MSLTNFPEMWVNRVETNLTVADQAPWLEGIEEIDTAIIEMGSGSASESNVIHIPTTDFEVEVLINNAAYPIALQQYTDDDALIQLDKYQTKVVPISDDQANGASYRRIDAVTSLMTRGMLIKKYSKAIWALAPAAHTVDTPILQSTGRSGKFNAAGDEIIWKVGGRLRLTFEDLVDHKAQWDVIGGDEQGMPEDGRRLVLCPDHWNDLLYDRGRFGDQLVNYKTGDPAPVIAGFQIYKYINTPKFSVVGAKLAYGAVAGAGEFKGSVSFYVTNIAKKTGLTKQYFAASNIDPENQTNKLAYRHYFICVPKRLKYIGAISSAYAPVV